MGALPEELVPVFSELQERSAPFAEYDVSDAVWSFSEALKAKGIAIPDACTWERMAFDYEEYPDDEATAGRYFGELIASKSGTLWPNPNSITPQILDYWTARSREAKHPLLRARYADLVWDFGARISGRKREVGSAQTAIDSYCELNRARAL